MREKLIELLDDYTEPLSAKDIHKADFAETFADHLIANGVTIPVRCKDCEFYKEVKDWDGNSYMACHNSADIVIRKKKPDDFCSYGERNLMISVPTEKEKTMVSQKVLNDLFKAFPDAIINRCFSFEFVADPNRQVNSCFWLEDCETREDVTAKVLEWFSREACKSEHFCVARRNKEVHEYHRQGINAFCGTNFSHDDMCIIYTRLGNRCNHQLTLDFIHSGYDMALLKRRTDNGN